MHADEHLLLYRYRGDLRLGAESFMFQEGDADLYSNARYGELKVDESGASVLIGLAEMSSSPCQGSRIQVNSQKGSRCYTNRDVFVAGLTKCILCIPTRSASVCV